MRSPSSEGRDLNGNLIVACIPPFCAMDSSDGIDDMGVKFRVNLCITALISRMNFEAIGTQNNNTFVIHEGKG